MPHKKFAGKHKNYIYKVSCTICEFDEFCEQKINKKWQL